MQADSAQQLRSLLEDAVGNSNQAAGGGGILGSPVSAAESVGQAIKHNVPLPEEAADILKTVGKLKALSPLYTYALYHPVRFLLRYLVLPLPSLLLFLVLAILQLVAYLVRSLLYPFYLALQLITAPARIAFSFLDALLPVWIFLGSAIFIGCCVGALAGLLLGGTTKHAIDKSIDLAVWPLRVIGLVEPPSRRLRTEEEDDETRNGFGARGGAKIEKIQMTRNRSDSGKGKGKAVERGRGRRGEDRKKAKEENLSTTDEERDSSTFVGSNSSFNGRGGTHALARKVHSMSSSSSEDEEEPQELGSSTTRATTREGRNANSRRNEKSGWRKRHVQDVLQ